MALAAYDRGRNKILVNGQPVELIRINRIPGASLAEQNAGHVAYMLPATLDSCLALKDQHIPFTDELRDFGNRLHRIQKYIESVKLETGNVEPLQPVPIKAPYSLYQHQIKAYNIALALFGRGARKEEVKDDEGRAMDPGN